MMTKQPAAPTSRAVKVVTGCVLAFNAGLYIAAFYQPALLWAGTLLSVIVLGSYYFWTPIEYEQNGDELIVPFRIGRVRYQRVVKSSKLDSPIGFGIRLFGNGGLFAGSGIFWSRKLGVFRAYVTTSKPADVVLVETAKTKVLISPREPRAWLTAK
jgi:Bacterial PH domain